MTVGVVVGSAVGDVRNSVPAVVTDAVGARVGKCISAGVGACIGADIGASVEIYMSDCVGGTVVTFIVVGVGRDTEDKEGARVTDVVGAGIRMRVVAEEKVAVLAGEGDGDGTFG